MPRGCWRLTAWRGPTGTSSRRLALLLPALLVIVVGQCLPLLIVLAYSFLSPGTYGGVVWHPTLDAYSQFLFERDIFDNTLTFSAPISRSTAARWPRRWSRPSPRS